jgi:hypothetical protein
MDKRSALVTAGGLAASFVAGIAAVSFDWGLLGSGTSAAAPARTHASPTPLKPIVKHRTVVIHKKSPASSSPAGARTITIPRPAAPGISASQPAPAATTSGSHTAGTNDGEDGIENDRAETE